MKPEEKRYRWANPMDWLIEKAQSWNEEHLRLNIEMIARLIDLDDLQHLYQGDMDEDGYFDPI